MAKYRYPGVNYFTEEDHEIFRGRKDETRRLFRRLLINKTLVLHSESGIGKSSLIRAGLIPYIEKHNVSIDKENKIESRKHRKVLPVTVRGISTADEKNDQNKTLIVDEVIRVTFEQAEKYIESDLEDLPIINKELSLWYLAKQIEFAGYDILFIFDQFEEIQSYSYEQIKYYEEELSKLFLSHIPKEIDNQIEAFISSDKGDEDSSLDLLGKLEKRLNASCLFVIREDRLAVMSSFTDRFPDILKHNFYLRGLDVNGAKDAITHPASLPGDYESPNFEYDPAVVKKIISKLKNKDTQLIDPLQVQIVCKSLEAKVIEQRKTVIKKSDLGSITNIISIFYKHSWSAVEDELDLSRQQINKIRKEVISKLVVGGKRVPVLKEQYSQQYDTRKVITLLEEKGFLRRLTTANGVFYELSHDRLIDPIKEDMIYLLAEEKTETERRKRIKKTVRITAIITLLIIFSLGAWNYLERDRQKTELASQVLSTISFANRDNPSFAYFLAKSYDTIISNKALDSIVNQLDKNHRVAPSKIIPLSSSFMSIEYDEKSDEY